MLDFLFGEGQYGLRFLFAFIVVLGLIGLTAWLVRRFGANHLGTAAARGRQPRLAVIDATAVDGRRRLVLIRRDNVEHLLMIGGPSDVVIESTIVRANAGRDAAPGRQLAPVPDALPRPTALDEDDSWAMPPEPAALPSVATRRGGPQSLDEPPAPWPEEPGLHEPPRVARPADPLAGLAAELSRHPPPEPAPAMAQPRSVRPRDVAREMQREPMREPPMREAMREPPMREAMREPVREPMREAMREPVREPMRDMTREPMREVAREPIREVAREPIREVARESIREVGREPMREVAREPMRAAQPQPVPETTFAPSADQNLAEMAQRLEAALRRPGGGGARPDARPESRPEPQRVEPQRVEPPRMEARPEPPRADARPEARPRPVAEPMPLDDPPPAPPAATEPKHDAKPAPQRSLYDSLEQEMASLLGRPNSKA